MAGQARRTVDAVPVAGAHRADAPGAGSGPGPVRPGRGPYPGQAADREAARGRPDQNLGGAHRPARGVRPGDDRGVNRRAAQPVVLAELARGRARTRRADLERALHGRFTDHHARLARLLLGQLDELTARINQVTELLDAAISALPTPTPATACDQADRTKGDASADRPTQDGYNSAV